MNAAGTNLGNPKTIYLHIGYNKTGTTAIQNNFFYNRKGLMKYGLFYPQKCCGKRKSPAHHSLAESLLYQIGKPLPKFVKTKIYSKFPKDHYWQLLHKELEGTTCETIFISSEAFSRLRGSREMMEYVKNQFTGYQVKILVYLRSQVEYFESAYNQDVKRNYETRTVEEMMQRGWLSMDYFDEIEQWAMVFGAENLIVKIFDRVQFPDGSIVKDVLSILELPALICKHKMWRFNTNFNIRLPNNMVEAKRRINQKIRLPRLLDSTVVFLLQTLGMFSDSKAAFTSEQKNLITSHFYESNKKLGEKYLGKAFPFHETNKTHL